MHVVRRLPTAAAFAGAAAEVIVKQIEIKPHSVLAAPTGNTPLGLYAELARRSVAAAFDLRQAYVFNLDEYVGLTRADSHSYAAYMDRHLVAPLDLSFENVRLLRGDAADLEQQCRAYDAAIAARGGIDLCILGLGVNGHVAFNEPGTDWNLTTHVVRLSAATRAAHAAQTADRWRIPPWGITVGIRTILEARAILLLIAGEGKEAAKRALYQDQVDARFPVTCLTNHPNLTIIELCGREESR